VGDLREICGVGGLWRRLDDGWSGRSRRTRVRTRGRTRVVGRLDRSRI
jgi:hypothetical protein